MHAWQAERRPRTIRRPVREWGDYGRGRGHFGPLLGTGRAEGWPATTMTTSAATLGDNLPHRGGEALVAAPALVQPTRATLRERARGLETVLSRSLNHSCVVGGSVACLAAGGISGSIGSCSAARCGARLAGADGRWRSKSLGTRLRTRPRLVGARRQPPERRCAMAGTSVAGGIVRMCGLSRPIAIGDLREDMAQIRRTRFGASARRRGPRPCVAPLKEHSSDFSASCDEALRPRRRAIV